MILKVSIVQIKNYQTVPSSKCDENVLRFIHMYWNRFNFVIYRSKVDQKSYIFFVKLAFFLLNRLSSKRCTCICFPISRIIPCQNVGTCTVPKAHNPEKIIIIHLWLQDFEQLWRVICHLQNVLVAKQCQPSEWAGQAILAILSNIDIYFLWLRKMKQKHFFLFHSKSEQSNLHIWKSYLAKLTLLG